jgi:protoporphyrinogen oxidase
MVVILGGGLAGLAAAWFLGDVPHVVLEAEEEPGGLCRSRRVDGFTFDYTGHLLHLRDPRTVALLDTLWPDIFDVIERKADIRMRGVTVPFPFQANLHGLPADLVADCILGVVETLSVPPPTDPAVSFRDWALATLGRGIAESFLFPYNGKLFRRDPAEMTADWVSWAIPRPTVAEVVRGALGLVNRGMGYNSTFRYPRRGGIDVVPRAFAQRLRTLRCGARVTEVDLARSELTLENGERMAWNHLVTTLPLPTFLGMLRGEGGELRRLADTLDWSVVGCLNLGIDREGLAGGAHWTYFPDPEVPFYRVGYPSHFSKDVAPPGTTSLYVEFGLKRGEPDDVPRRTAQALQGLRQEGILRAEDRVLAQDWIRIDPGYVIFDRARQDTMARVMPELARRRVHAIGRYGAWTYSYMERAILDGLETAAHLRAAVSAQGRA